MSSFQALSGSVSSTDIPKINFDDPSHIPMIGMLTDAAHGGLWPAARSSVQLSVEAVPERLTS